MRDSYDGIQDDRIDLRSGRRQRRPIFAVVLLLGFVIILLCLILMWNKLFPAEDAPATVPEQQTSEQVKVQPPVAAQVQHVEDAPVIQTESKEETVPSLPKPVESVPPTTAVSLDEAPKVASRASKNAVQYEIHEVAEGESLDSIASTYALKTQTLISVNKIRNINAVVKGSTLRIPDRDGQIYTVKNGDMLSLIARSFGMGWHSLMEVNGLVSEMIHPGQELFIPDNTTKAESTATLADVATVSFQKPAQGKIVQSFLQSSSAPVDKDGILIEGEWGDPVFVSADGDVVDVGLEPQGRGRFVVVSHVDGYKTTYAHLESVDVRGGDKVDQGQMIGTIGTSGTTWDTPKLFFKLEQSGYALDPSTFL